MFILYFFTFIFAIIKESSKFYKCVPFGYSYGMHKYGHCYIQARNISIKLDVFTIYG